MRIKMQVITSKDNEIIKNIKKLKEKKYRDEEGLYIIEGIKIIEEAIEENADINKIVICDECIATGSIEQKLMYTIAKYDCIYVSKKVFNFLTDVVAPQGILAVVAKPSRNTKIRYDQDIILALDGIQDPGNLGTILRTADSVNLKQIIVTKSTADSYNPKVVRATMGAIFRVPVVVEDDLCKTLQVLHECGIQSYAAHLKGESFYQYSYQKASAFLIGNEGNGLSDALAAVATSRIKIPMHGQVESLNAATAATVLMYEAMRQRLR